MGIEALQLFDSLAQSSSAFQLFRYNIPVQINQRTNKARMIFFLITSAFICAASDALRFNCSTTPLRGTANEMGFDWSVYYSWKGRVPYFFSNRVIQQDKDFVRKQMDFIESKTCVKFIEQSQFSVPDHHMEIDIEPRSCMESGFGLHFSAGVKVGHDRLKVLFASSYRFADQPHCGDNSEMIRSGVIHELFHALGAIHTHQRKDRDYYVTYNRRCLRDPGNWDQFNKVEFSMHTSKDIKYEFSSIMHYECDTWSRCPPGSGCQCNTLEPNDGTSCSDIKSDLPTEMDWKMIREYQCAGDPGTPSKPAIPTKQPPIPSWPWGWPNLPWYQIPSFCSFTDVYDPQWCAWHKRRCMMDADVSTNCAATCYC